MFTTRLLRRSSRLLVVGYFVLALLLVQGLRVHFHAFADHEPVQGHSHAVELHVSGVPTDSGHDDPAGETDFARFALHKLKQGYADSVVLPLVVSVLIVALTGPALWWPARFARPTTRGDIRTPPQRAPPR